MDGPADGKWEARGFWIGEEVNLLETDFLLELKPELFNKMNLISQKGVTENQFIVKEGDKSRGKKFTVKRGDKITRVEKRKTNATRERYLTTRVQSSFLQRKNSSKS